MATQRHPLAAIALALACGLAAVGCTPTPAPASTATATGFLSDAEAFAAAEATYRAYVDATNARRSNPASRPDPTDFLTGDALNSVLQAQEAFAAKGIRLVGTSELTSVALLNNTTEATIIHVCLDNSGTKVVDSQGNDATPPGRSPIGGLRVVVLSAPQAQISESTSDDVGC